MERNMNETQDWRVEMGTHTLVCPDDLSDFCGESKLSSRHAPYLTYTANGWNSQKGPSTNIQHNIVDRCYETGGGIISRRTADVPAQTDSPSSYLGRVICQNVCCPRAKVVRTPYRSARFKNQYYESNVMLHKSGIIVPMLELERNDEKLVQKLATTLLQQNLDQYSDLAGTNDGHPDSRSWAAIQKREGIRVYKESTRQQRQHIRAQAATGNSSVRTAKVPPSLLLMGTVKGNLDDLLYATAASSTEAMLTKSKFINDGVVASKVLARIIEPTMADPMHFLNVTWRYCALSEPRDYVCLDVAGWSNTERGERVAYHLIHSVGFDALPSYEHKGIARVNMSVCWIFRQKTATLVECYARGFYDLATTNAMLNSISMHTIASQWLSCAKLISYAQSMKLARLVNCVKGPVSSDCSESDNNDGCFGNSALFSSQSMPSSTSSFGDFIMLLPTRREPTRVSASCCKLCCKSFCFLGASRRVCQACDQDVCSRCSIKETLCLFSQTRQRVRESKKNFCKHCVAGAMRSKVGALVRDDFIATAPTQHSW